MDEPFWQQRWESGQTRFHEGQVNEHLVAYEDALSRGQARRVLVPLCGKTVDLAWLASRGHQPVGVEIVDLAIAKFFAEQEVEAAVLSAPSGHPIHRGGGVEIHRADFFAVSAKDVGPIDCVWDRAALVALPADTRAAYVGHVLKLCVGPLLLNSFTYDQAIMDGPPFSVDQDEVRALYAARDIELLWEKDAIDEVPFKELGLKSYLSTVYLIR